MKTVVLVSELLASSVDYRILSDGGRRSEGGDDERSKVLNWVILRDFQAAEDKSISELQRKLPKVAGQDVASTDNPFKFVIPKKVQELYRSLENKLSKRNLMYELCHNLVTADKKKIGFLSNPKIHKCFEKVGFELSKKEIATLTYILHREEDETYSYPELVCRLFGKQGWENVKAKYDLRGPGMEANFGEQDEKAEKNIIISQKLKLKIEFYF